MDNTFELKKGKIVFEEDKIIIADDAKYEKRYRLFSALLLLFAGLYFFTKFGINSVTSSFTFVWMFIGFGLLILFEYFKSVQSVIFYKDVKSIKLNRIFFRDVLNIRLHNNKSRRVNGIYNAERLKEYIESIYFQNKFS